MDVKQVIVIRKDLKMRRGKEIAQGAHASMAWLVELIYRPLPLSSAERAWLSGSFKKICLQVESEEQLMAVHDEAVRSGLTVHLITDLGLTEFNEPTTTCLAIGPAESERIDLITGNLKLY